jgi:hypothetical protein
MTTRVLVMAWDGADREVEFASSFDSRAPDALSRRCGAW